MQKGKYGICLWFYAVLAFILAFLGQTILCAALLGFVIVTEKNEWLSKQAIQAFFLSIFANAVSKILDSADLYGTVPYYNFGYTRAVGIINGLVGLAILVFVILAIVRTAKGQDAGIPGFSSLANKAFGFVAPKVYSNPNQGNYNNAYNPNYANQAPNNNPNQGNYNNAYNPNYANQAPNNNPNYANQVPNNNPNYANSVPNNNPNNGNNPNNV